MKKPKLDEFHYHEMTDRLNVVMMVIENNLTQHPVAKLNKDIQNLIDDAHDKLFEAYQLSGRKELDCDTRDKMER
jgi:hypothetical protein